MESTTDLPLINAAGRVVWSLTEFPVDSTPELVFVDGAQLRSSHRIGGEAGDVVDLELRRAGRGAAGGAGLGRLIVGA